MVLARAPPFQDLLRRGYKRGLHLFQGGEIHLDALVHLQKKTGAGGGGSESQPWRRRFGACFMLTMPESSRNRPSNSGKWWA